MPVLPELLAAVDGSQDEIVNLLCDLIRFETVNTGVMPTGNELPLCRYLQEKLAAEGIEAQLYHPAENRANLVARLPGRRGTPRLLYMGHADVVPVENEAAWRYPPFAGVVAEGRVWGRGAADMKDLVTAEVMALILLKRAGVELAGDLLLAVASDEETGGHAGFAWLAEHAPDAIRADYALNEIGGGPLKTAQGLVYTLQVGEKGRLELQITFHGRAAHAATPWLGDNVAFRLGEVLRRLEAYQPELDVSHPFYTHLVQLLGLPEPITVENVDAVADALSAQDPQLGSILRSHSRMTLVPTLFSGGVKSNSVPSHATLACDVRTLPHQDEAYVRSQAEQILAGIADVSYELIYTAVPSASPYETEFADALRRATALAAGRDDLSWLPSLVTGFTDSRLVRPLGTTVYGFSPASPESDLTIPNNIHAANESTEIRSLLFRTKLLLALACDLLG